MLHLAEAPRHAARRRAFGALPTGRWPVAAVVTVVATVLSTVALTRRTLWLDEIATTTSALRSWSDLAALLHEIDLVHAGYYAVMHVWFDVAGYSPLTLRLPSAIAVGVASGLLVLVATRLASLRAASVAGLVLPVLPIVAYAGTTGRSQGFELLLAVAATLVLLNAVSATRLRARPGIVAAWWLGYAAVAAIGIVMLLWSAFVIAAHALSLVIWFLRAPRERWLVLTAGAASVLVAGAAVLPFVLAVVPQSKQIGWLQRPTLAEAVDAAVRHQFFDFPLVHTSTTVVTVLATVSWVLASVGAVAVARARVDGLTVLLPWLIAPTVVLLGASMLATPVYTAHYVTYSAAPLAVLIGAGVAAFLPRLKGVVSVALLIAFLAPALQVWWSVRTAVPTTTDLRAAADWLVEERRGEQRPAGLLLGDMAKPSDQFPIGYPDAVAGLRNLSVTATPAEANYFFSRRALPLDVLPSTRPLRTVWYIADDSAEIRAVTAALTAEGFRTRARFDFTGGALLEYER